MSGQGNYPIGREVDEDKIYVQGPGRMRRSAAYGALEPSARLRRDGLKSHVSSLSQPIWATRAAGRTARATAVNDGIFRAASASTNHNFACASCSFLTLSGRCWRDWRAWSSGRSRPTGELSVSSLFICVKKEI